MYLYTYVHSKHLSTIFKTATRCNTCVSIYIYIYTYTYIPQQQITSRFITSDVYTYIHLHIQLCMYIDIRTCTYKYVYKYMYIQPQQTTIYINNYVYIFIYIYVYMYSHSGQRFNLSRASRWACAHAQHPCCYFRQKYGRGEGGRPPGASHGNDSIVWVACACRAASHCWKGTHTYEYQHIHGTTRFV